MTFKVGDRRPMYGKNMHDGAANINLNEAINKGQRQEENED